MLHAAACGFQGVPPAPYLEHGGNGPTCPAGAPHCHTSFLRLQQPAQQPAASFSCRQAARARSPRAAAVPSPSSDPRLKTHHLATPLPFRRTRQCPLLPTASRQAMPPTARPFFSAYLLFARRPHAPAFIQPPSGSHARVCATSDPFSPCIDQVLPPRYSAAMNASPAPPPPRPQPIERTDALPASCPFISPCPCRPPSPVAGLAVVVVKEGCRAAADEGTLLWELLRHAAVRSAGQCLPAGSWDSHCRM